MAPESAWSPRPAAEHSARPAGSGCAGNGSRCADRDVRSRRRPCSLWSSHQRERIDGRRWDASETERRRCDRSDPRAGFCRADRRCKRGGSLLGTLPGHGYENVRRPILHTLNLAHLLPTTAVLPGLASNPCPFYPPNSPPLLLAKTSGHTPFRFNLHADDVGHTLMMGPTGAGKSTHLALIEASFLRYPRARICKFDKGYSSFALCHALGG